MEELIVPNDYDILKSYVNEINGNDSEMDDIYMGFRRNNHNIVGYMVVDKAEKGDCLGDGICITGKDNKPWIESNGIMGKGMYFYEYNFMYAFDVAKAQNKDIVGAVIRLDKVLDFTDGTAIHMINNNQENFNQYIEQKRQHCIKKLQSFKRTTSNSFLEYKNELDRLNNGKISIEDYFDYFNIISKQQKQGKFDAVRFIDFEHNNLCLGILKYQTTKLCLLNQNKVVEYFNPLNKQECEMIKCKYFDAKPNKDKIKN